jgi:cupin 2 domain-containing protein
VGVYLFSPGFLEGGEGMSDMTTIPPGRYRHYKGNEYTVIGTARHSESLEKLVVYRQEYGAHGLWVRPERMFLETVNSDGREVPRFQPSGSSNEQIADRIKNVFDDLPRQLPKELVEILIRTADVRIERIISHGHASPADFWYDQAQHEWVIVLQGAARLQFEDGIVEMRPGDFINIPAFKRHRVAWTTPDEPTVWLGVRYGDQGQVT